MKRFQIRQGLLSAYRKGSQAMQTLIEDLLSFSQTTVSEQKFEKLDLNKIIDDIAEELKEAFPQNPAVIVSKGMCDVIIIPFQFRQLLQNLISNALKFSLPGVPTQIMISSETKKADHSGQRDYCLVKCIAIFVLVIMASASIRNTKTRYLTCFSV
jgi:light-regulated signal transduction histidine kinase (bacteriophytochrome)